MKISGLGWMGLRTDKFEETVRLLKEVMGIPLIREEPTVAGFRVSDQFSLEVYRPEDEFHAFFTTGPVVGFLVDDVDRARSEMEAAGIEFLGPIQRADGASWNHFRLPDGTFCELISRSV